MLQALDRYYDRLERRGEVVMPGWSTEPLGLVLELAEDGTPLGLADRLTARGKPQLDRVPKWFSRSGTGSTPFFLWDNLAYALGLGTKDPAKTARDHAAFRDLHLRELAGERDPALAALRRFVEAWVPDPEAARALGLQSRHMALNLGFRLRGETVPLHHRPAAAAHVERLRAAHEGGPEGFCLVRGARLPLVRLHPKVKGIDGGAAAEIPLVSFNQDAFTSYGHDQGFNAPTSAAAAFRYGAALNALLQRGGPNRLRIADSTVAFWADARAYDASVAEPIALAAEDIFGDALRDGPGPAGTTDARETQALREALVTVAEARAAPDLRPDLMENVPFFVLGLAPNMARVAVRYWLAGTFGSFRRALDAHAAALAIEPKPRGWGAKPPSPARLLLKTTALAEEFDNIPHGLAAEVTRAILENRPYPRTWLAATIARLRAGDDPGRGWHAAAIKACLNRRSEREMLPVALDPAHTDPAYQLGRLFAVLEAAQRTALPGVNTTIGDRWYAAASSTPARVFGPLLRSLKTHVADARKRGLGGWIEPKVAEIMQRLPPDLPRVLSLEAQGRFAVGYYHERGTRPEKKTDSPTTTGTDPEETPHG
ncbi:type I-C CRISPR-associated protein Cas8c/Csd1 [Methylobacterium sp. CB376]|uniref:type I-C CRISPR-associated protein Cas8c/Csd1 n=1 Tax=unclassified Methylobacterium TaxID=2615210 RepID=UPI00223EF6C5|nr:MULTISPECIES: type I-C CRISPR-associated protein Cas8c/Csd1 [Methylobacterium]WFT83524.1 type I-C CRISPR-associated protein Cas8c/Csd1 [Methylobacterium nodulans]